jgi:hypothetical protein
MSAVGFDPRDPTQRWFTGYALAGYPDPRDGALDAYVAELRTGGSPLRSLDHRRLANFSTGSSISSTERRRRRRNDAGLRHVHVIESVVAEAGTARRALPYFKVAARADVREHWRRETKADYSVKE